MIWCYTHFYLNLSLISSQRDESYHSVMRQITNDQLSIEQSVRNFIRKMQSLLKDITVDEKSSIRKYPRVAQLHDDAF